MVVQTLPRCRTLLTFVSSPLYVRLFVSCASNEEGPASIETRPGNRGYIGQGSHQPPA